MAECIFGVNKPLCVDFAFFFFSSVIVCTRECLSARVYKYMRVHVCTHAHMSVFMHKHTCVCLCSYVSGCTWCFCVYIWLACLCVSSRVCACLCVSVHVRGLIAVYVTSNIKKERWELMADRKWMWRVSHKAVKGISCSNTFLLTTPIQSAVTGAYNGYSS